MAQDLANILGTISPDAILNMRLDEEVILIEGKLVCCKQARYYNDKLFGPFGT